MAHGVNIANFENKVMPEPHSGCHLWMAYCNTWGYGVFAVARKPKLAHRVAYEHYVGGIPHGLLVLHRCDVPSCVRPDHLFLGTNADNMEDMVSKGRADRTKKARGEANGGAKLTVAQARSIRGDDRTQAVIAKEYGITQPSVSAIKSRRKWRDA